MEATFTFKAPEDIANRLQALARRMERPKSYIIRKALEQFLEEEEDYILSMQRLSEDKPSRRISLEQLKHKHGLES